MFDFCVVVGLVTIHATLNLKTQTMNQTDKAPYDSDSKLLEIAKRYESLIRSQIPSAPTPSEKLETMRKDKEDSDIRLISLRPRNKWFYCVGVGKHARFRQDEGKGRFDWFIAARILKKEHHDPALRILENIETQRRDFFVVKPGDKLCNGKEFPYLHIFKRYYLRDNPVFSADKIAKDLVWLVAETFPKFAEL